MCICGISALKITSTNRVSPFDSETPIDVNLQTPSFTVHLLAAKNVLVHLLIEVILGPCVAPNEAHNKPTNKIYYGKLTVEFARTLGGSPFSRRTCVNTSTNPSREVSSSSLSSSLSVSLMRACRF